MAQNYNGSGDTEDTTCKKQGNALAKQGDFNAAILCYDAGLKINPNNLDLLHNKYVILKKIGNIEESDKCAKLIQRIRESNLDAKKISLSATNSDAENIQNAQKNPSHFQKKNFCRFCGTKLSKENANFCPSCGKDLLNADISAQIEKEPRTIDIVTENIKKPFEVFNKIGDAVKQGTKKVSYTLLLHKQNNHIKKLIITQFNLYELQQMCAYFNIGIPHPTKTNSRGERYSIEPKFHHWVEHVMNRVGYASVREYAKKKNKIPSDVVELEKKYHKERLAKYPEFEASEEKTVSSIVPAQISDSKSLQELINVIQGFRPIKHFTSEELYHTNLFTYISERIPVEVAFEEQRGRSRPDIVVGDIAIEVKGPTDHQGLQTIADKMLRYPQHFEYIIVVLFDVRVYEPMYHEWYSGIMNHYKGKLTVIRIDEIASGKSATVVNEKTLHPRSETGNGYSGFCIRCGEQIPYNDKKPLCVKCYESWAKYLNDKFSENYCHNCGKKSKQSYSKPVCYDCWKRTHS